MAQISKHHRTLTNGVGKCSAPMWCNGMPAGFCDEAAYGNYIEGPTYWSGVDGRRRRVDGKYAGYVPALACPAHGGPGAPSREQGSSNG